MAPDLLDSGLFLLWIYDLLWHIRYLREGLCELNIIAIIFLMGVVGAYHHRKDLILVRKKTCVKLNFLDS